MSTENTWKVSHANLPQNEDTDRNFSSFVPATASLKDPAEPTKNLTEDPNKITTCVSPITGNVKLLHSLINTGGTRARPANKFMALDRRGPSTQPVLLSE